MRIKDFQGGGYILNKARRLLIPYFSVSIAYIPLRLFASQMASSTYSMRDIWKIFLGVSPNGGAWFLYVLFLFNLMTFIFTKEEHLKIVVIISFVISLLTKGKILNIEFSVLRYVCFNYFFFVSGLLCAIDKKINFKKKISESRLIYQISAFVIIYIIFQYLSCYIFSTILGTIGVSIVLSISYKISETVLKYREVLAQLGQDSMYIYIIHGPVQVIVRYLVWSKINLPYGICVLILFVSGLFVSLIVECLVVKKIKPLNWLCTGEWK